MLFTENMSRKKIYTYSLLGILVLFTWIFTNTNNNKDNFSELVKVSLRSVGDQLLVSNQDSTSLVMPVLAFADSKYKLLFQKRLSFEPENLVAIVERTFKKAGLSKNYLVEVKQCTDQEVAYSYNIKDSEAHSIIPCKGRILPKSCYAIEVRFLQKTTFLFKTKYYIYLVIFIVFLLFEFIVFKKKSVLPTETTTANYNILGSFHFYPEQNKLVKAAVEISLSRKECELLEIFVSKPNQIIKREELVKKVWEDNGVIVGRSLDTYISKLRKKLKADTNIKLTNVHGIGYKLEVFYC
jgi:hypothetical protein